VEDKDNSNEELTQDYVDQANELEMDEDIYSGEIEEATTDNSHDDVECMDIEGDNQDEVKIGKSFFKKDKKEKKDKKDIKIDELNDKLMRTMAEFDNFRKRSEKEKSQMFEIGAKDIIERVLPVVDNFERGLGTITEEEKEGAFAQGIEKIYKQLVSSLEDAGLKAIEATGKEFNPNLHNAVMHAEDPDQDENIVSDEFQKGYMYRDTIVRHSMVKVVN